MREKILARHVHKILNIKESYIDWTSQFASKLIRGGDYFDSDIQITVLEHKTAYRINYYLSLKTVKEMAQEYGVREGKEYDLKFLLKKYQAMKPEIDRKIWK